MLLLKRVMYKVQIIEQVEKEQMNKSHTTIHQVLSEDQLIPQTPDQCLVLVSLCM